MTHTPELKPWPAGTTCPAEGYTEFAAALNQASHHYADDSGKEWGAASACMERAVQTAVNAAWPYWAMKRMYAEIAPLPTFDSFMAVYCKGLRADRDALLEALEEFQTHVIRHACVWDEAESGSHHHPIWQKVATLLARIRGEG